MTYWLHPAAEDELTDAAVYYAEHASRRVADTFLTEFERVAALVSRTQQLGAPLAEGLRVHPFRRFPYAVVYREADSGPQIYAVPHYKREPGYWQSRL